MDTLVGAGHLEAGPEHCSAERATVQHAPVGAVAMPPVNTTIYLLMDTHVEFKISFVIAKRGATSMID
jgi:hypothetical protein